MCVCARVEGLLLLPSVAARASLPPQESLKLKNSLLASRKRGWVGGWGVQQAAPPALPLFLGQPMSSQPSQVEGGCFSSHMSGS